MKGRFWTSLTQKKYEIYFFEEHRRRCLSIEWWINLCTALAASGSLAVWFIDNNYAKVYASIIVISEIVKVVQPYLPFQNRITELNEAISRLDIIYEDMENTFFSFNDETTEDEINNKCSEYEKKWLDCTDRYLKKDDLEQENEEINNIAKKKRDAYFKNLNKGVEWDYAKEVSEEA